MSEAKNVLVLQWFFFFSVNNFFTRRSAPIFTISNFSFSKLEQDGTLRKSFFDFLYSFLTRREKLTINYEKPQKTGFANFAYIYFSIISKIIILLSWNFQQNCIFVLYNYKNNENRPIFDRTHMILRFLTGHIISLISHIFISP